jgi:hypothetical protein
MRSVIVNLYGRSRIARANLSASRSWIGGRRDCDGSTDVGAAHTPQLGSPAPTIAPQLRQSVGRPAGFEFEELSDNTLRLTSVMLRLQSITLGQGKSIA